MLDEERGTYSPPTEDNLSYEARRRPRQDQAPLTLIISGIFLVLLLMAVVIFYNSGMSTHGRTPPEVGDTLGDLKDTKVQDAQPLSDQELADPGSDSGTAKFAPGSEVPAVRPTVGETDQAPPAASAIAGPLPSQADNPALKPVAVPGTPAAASVSSSVAAVRPPVAAASATAPVAAVAGTGSVVQIGAFTSQDLANTEYNRLASSYGLFLGGTAKRIEKVETPSGIFYRTAFTGFASADKAHAFCQALHAAGHDCFVK